MKFYPKTRVIVCCSLFICAFLRLSYWQWTRHQQKEVIIQELEHRLLEPPTPIETLKSKFVTPEDIAFKRVTVTGHYDFDHEVILRNRRYKNAPGVFILTPLHLDTGDTVIVNRGFTPLELSLPEKRKTLNQPQSVSFVGLIKQSQPKIFLAPSDPESGKDLPWVDAWLRPDIASIGKQLPYEVLPFFIEIVGDDPTEDIEKKIVLQKSEKAEIFMPSAQIYSMVGGGDVSLSDPHLYPIPVFDPVIPPARHLGYVFEWAAMALITFLIGLLFQTRPPRGIKPLLCIFFIPFLLSGCSIFRSTPKFEDGPVVCSYYGGNDGFQGKKTASGEIFDDRDLTAAHRSLPFGTILKLKNPDNGRTCLVRITDRGPYVEGRDLDISRGAAFELGMLRSGVSTLEAEVR